MEIFDNKPTNQRRNERQREKQRSKEETANYLTTKTKVAAFYNLTKSTKVTKVAVFNPTEVITEVTAFYCVKNQQGQPTNNKVNQQGNSLV